MIDAITIALLVTGGVFYFSGTVGLLRFPDTLSRLHALTKADNLGLGCVVAGLALQAGSPSVAAKLVLIWLLVLLASSNSAYLIARSTAPRREATAASGGASTVHSQGGEDGAVG